ncbi:MAG: hypothetical protein ACRDAU_08595 [Clostridium sp.]
MELFVQLFKSFLGQGLIGWGVILVILIALGYSIYLNINVKGFYRELLREFEGSRIINEAGEREFRDEILLGISEDFKKSANKGIENINTEVLILNHLKKKQNFNERILSLIPASAIGLGLLGTFLGLTISIHGTNGVLESGVQTMEGFLANMSVPLQGMSSAFWTSIFGVAVSLVLNSINMSTRKEKDRFFDQIEGYLDNTLYGEYSYSFVTQFEKFNEIVSTAMIRLAKDMRELFMNGVNELVSNINKNTLDMTNTAKELGVYAEDFGKVIHSLGETIDSFNEPIENFKGSINEFTITTDKLEFIMNGSIERLEDKLDYLSGVINNLNIVATSEKEIFTKALQEVEKGRREISSTYLGVVDTLKNINTSIISRDKNLTEEIQGLNSGYGRFEDITVEFKENIKGLQGKIELGVKNSIEKGFLKISDDIVNELKVVLEEIDESIGALSMNTQTVGRLVKATNDWIDIRRD